MKSKISIIIPCFNAAKYIDECLHSLLNQTYGRENLEIILVDDCSTDDTVSILQRYESEYPEQILLILCEKNGRQGTARNIGLNYASGEYVSFIDADDWVRLDMYEELVNAAKVNDSDIVQFRYSSDTDTVLSTDSISYKYYNIDSRKDRLSLLLGDEILNQSGITKLYKRDLLALSQVGYGEGVCYEEPLFTYPLKFYAKNVCVTEQPFIYYRQHEKSTVHATMKEMNSIGDHLFVQMSLYQFMKGTPFYKEFKDEIDLFFLHSYGYEPLLFMSARKLEISNDFCKYLGKNIMQQLPGWESNSYIHTPGCQPEFNAVKTLTNLYLQS